MDKEVGNYTSLISTNDQQQKSVTGKFRTLLWAQQQSLCTQMKHLLSNSVNNMQHEYNSSDLRKLIE